MKTLLLCGYRNSEQDEDILGLERDADGVTLIDRRIGQLRALDHQVVCVLAGSHADEQLRQSRLIEDCELVFDTNEPCNLISNTRSGAFVCDGEACFIWPIEIPPPPIAVWNFLRNEYGKVGFATSHAFLQTVSPQGAPCHFGFPLLMTREGGKVLRKLSDLRSLVDTRLKTLHLEFDVEAELEPAVKPL
jgi:hypothetical protein